MSAVEQRLNTKAAAAYLGLAPKTMRNLRSRGEGPAWSRAGTRIVVYRIPDLEAYLRPSSED